MSNIPESSLCIFQSILRRFSALLGILSANSTSFAVEGRLRGAVFDDSVKGSSCSSDDPASFAALGVAGAFDLAFFRAEGLRDAVFDDSAKVASCSSDDLASFAALGAARAFGVAFFPAEGLEAAGGLNFEAFPMVLSFAEEDGFGGVSWCVE
jgi:hypothetical protein